jgi:CHAD domain-containing protein
MSNTRVHPGASDRAVMRANGDRAWSGAGRETLNDLASLVSKRAKDVRSHVDVDAVHDMRTATRRLRTAVKLHAQDAPARRRVAVEDELKRVSRRLGAVRDLDILLEEVDKSAGDLEPLRDAWRAERAANARRLTAELDRRRFRRALRCARGLGAGGQGHGHGESGSNGPADRVATQAPALIWDAFGAVLAYEVDPMSADPTTIHQLRIASKKLR